MNTLHPIMAAALAGFMPFAMSTKEDDEYDEEYSTDAEQDDEDEAHQEICNACSGSGEGQSEGASCRICRGLGEVWVTE